MKEMVDAVEKFAVEQNILKEDALQMTVDECIRKWHTFINPTKCTISVADAAALMFNFNLSINQYQMIRTLCLKHGVEFPTRNKVVECKRTYHPEITSYQLKSSVSVTSLLDETVSSLIKSNKKHVKNNGVYHLLGTFGVVVLAHTKFASNYQHIIGDGGNRTL